MTLRPTSLRARLTLWYTALLTGMLAMLGATALWLLDRGLRDNIDASLKSAAVTIADSLRRPVRAGRDLGATLDALLGYGPASRFFRLLDPFGRPDPRLAPRSRLKFPLSPQARRNAGQGRETYQTLNVTDPTGAPADIRVLTLPVVERGRVAHLVQVAVPLDSADAARSRFLLILLGLAPIALGGSAVGGWFLARKALAPVDAMVASARRIEAEDLSQRLAAANGTDELGRLASVLNDMLARLEASFSAVRHFSADAAHELRTPLTILKGELEVALRAPPSPDEYRRVLVSCLEEVDRLSALVSDLLFLARSDGGNLSVTRDPVDLASVLRDAGAALQVLADEAEVSFRWTANASVWTRGSREMLFRLIFNLGENAIAYTPAGGSVTLSLAPRNTEAELTVQDTGIGIAPDEQDRIFDRFYRSDPARGRGHAGLGLALARSIAAAHQGSIDVESTPGRGSCFRVRLPLTAEPSGSKPETPDVPVTSANRASAE